MENPIDQPHREIDYRDNSIRSSRIILIFRITLFFYILIIAANYYLRHVAKTDYSILYTDKNLVLIQSLIFFINYPLIILMIIFFLQWFHRSYYNLQQIPEVKTLFKPNWAAICWFIPIFNLIVPYLMMREVVLKNIAVREDELNPGRYNFKIATWWILYIFGTYFSTSMGIWYVIYPNENSPLVILKWNMIFLSALIISLFVVISLIRKINEWETDLRESQT